MDSISSVAFGGYQAGERDAGISAELATSLAALLDYAGRELDGNQAAARASIARASSLIRVELDRRSVRTDPDVAHGKLTSWQVQRLQTYVDRHLDHTIRLKDLSGVAKRSTSYFGRTFKRTFGETPHAYITRRRLHRARRLMLTSDMALCEIALACGFTDQAHLCKLFRQNTGQSPAVWRRERCDAPYIVPTLARPSLAAVQCAAAPQPRAD